MKPVLRIFCGGLAVAALLGILLQRRALSAVRAENQRLQVAGEEVARLARENASVEPLRQDNRELDRLRLETRELHGLRNEVRQLRDQAKGLPAVRVENERLRRSKAVAATPAPTADTRPMLASDQLSFMGYASPEATLQSFFWTIKQGDLDAALRCFSDEAREQMGDETPEAMRRGMEEMSKRFKGLRIAARKTVSADEIHLGLQLESEGNDAPDEQVIPFKRVGGEWRIGGMK